MFVTPLSPSGKLRSVLVVLVFLIVTAFPCSALAIGILQAVKASDPISTDLGLIKAGNSLYLVLAADDYSENPAKVTWSLKVDGTNPVLKLSSKKGAYTILYSDSLKSPKRSDGVFADRVTAKTPEGSSSSVKFTGTIGEAPVFKTTKLPKCSVKNGETYNAKIVLKSGNEPITWKFHSEWMNGKGSLVSEDYDIASYDMFLPEGFTAKIEKDSKGSSYLLIDGKITSEFPPAPILQEDDYGSAIPISIIASNDAGYYLQNYTIRLDPVKPKFILPKGFQKTYTVEPNQYINIDLSGITVAELFGGDIDLDENSRNA